MVVRKIVARAQRLHLLSRYYVNKWHYDGSKWAERVWYGERKNAATSIASVPFMITRTMRAQLETAGFPAREIASLVPQTAHQLIADNVTFAQYKQRQLDEIAALAAQAAEAIALEESQAKQDNASAEPRTPHDLVVVVSAPDDAPQAPAAALAVVAMPQQHEDEDKRN